MTRGDGERRLPGALRRRLAAFLREIAARLSGDRRQAGRLDEWRERFPGAPDHWLEVVRRSAPGLAEAPPLSARRAAAVQSPQRFMKPAEPVGGALSPERGQRRVDIGSPVPPRPIVRFAPVESRSIDHAAPGPKADMESPGEGRVEPTARRPLVVAAPVFRRERAADVSASSPTEKVSRPAGRDGRAPAPLRTRPIVVELPPETGDLAWEQTGPAEPARVTRAGVTPPKRETVEFGLRRRDARPLPGSRGTVRPLPDDRAVGIDCSAWPVLERWPRRDAGSFRYGSATPIERTVTRAESDAGGESEYPALGAGRGGRNESGAELAPSWPDLPAVPEGANGNRGEEAAAAARLRRLIADQEERGWSGSRS